MACPAMRRSRAQRSMRSIGRFSRCCRENDPHRLRHLHIACANPPTTITRPNGAARAAAGDGGRMRVRVMVVASFAACLLPGAEGLHAQSALGEPQGLPPVTVSAPVATPRRARPRPSGRIDRAAPAPRTVYLYPTSPTTTSGSRIDVDKVTAGINYVDARAIERAHSLNVADALQQQVAGILINEVSGNPFQPDIQFHGFVASP